jgi:hypothetical protein
MLGSRRLSVFIFVVSQQPCLSVGSQGKIGRQPHTDIKQALPFRREAQGIAQGQESIPEAGPESRRARGAGSVEGIEGSP